MKKRLTSIFRRSGQRGIALILTLAIITLVTLILIAFVTSMRVENTASKSFNDVLKAREIAQGAVDQAVATIRQATTRGNPMPNGAAGTILNYVTFPGTIYDFSGTLPAVRVPLYSQAPPSDTFDMNDAVNGTMWLTGKGGEFPIGNNSLFPVGWNYVLQNPAQPPGVNNPIIGRYAYWVDDEASKINLNTAGTPTPAPPVDYGTSVSNDVDLSVLLASMNSLPTLLTFQNKQLSPGFTTIEEVKLADPLDTDFQANRFSLTAYSKDANYPNNYVDDLDAFDRQRLVVSNLKTTPDIDGSADGAYTRLSDVTTLPKVYSSVAPAATFDGKYGGAIGLKQMIANIIAYQIDPSTTPPPDDGSVIPTTPAYVGLAKTPYINEIQVEYIAVDLGTTPASYSLARNVRVVLIYPYGADGSTYTTPANTEKIIVDNLPTWVGSPFAAGPFTLTLPAGSFSGLPPAATAYNIYLVQSDPPVTIPGSLLVKASVATPTITYTRDYAGVPHRLDYAQANLSAKAMAGSGKFYQYSVAQDPAVNDASGQWTALTANGALPATQNSTYPNGNDVSKMFMRAGPMQTIGELGYIHTPTAWKHLTLQPQPLAEKALNQIPDWAMLDLFTTATPPSQTGGRININSFINPGLAAAAPNWPRLVPLKALLNSVPGLVVVATATQNIYNDDNTTARNGTLDVYGMVDQTTGEPIFDTIGELCELPSLTNNTTRTDAGKEAAIRRIGNLITVRSNTFTIWVIAQSIKQPPTNLTPGTFVLGTDIITGEVRAQAVVERYEKTPGTPGLPGNPSLFRTRYFRYLYN